MPVKSTYNSVTICKFVSLTALLFSLSLLTLSLQFRRLPVTRRATATTWRLAAPISASMSTNGAVTEVPTCKNKNPTQPLNERAIQAAAAEAGLPPALVSYANKHHVIRTCFESDDCVLKHFGSDNANIIEGGGSDEMKGWEKRRPRAIVWKCMTTLCGGLGDRMRGIQLVFLLAVTLDRAFFIEWPRTKYSPFALSTAVHPAAIDWQPPSSLRRLRAHAKVWNGTDPINAQSERTDKEDDDDDDYNDDEMLGEEDGNEKNEFESLRVADIRFKQSSPGVLINPFEAGEPKHLFLNSSDFRTVFEPYDIVYVSNRIQRSALHLLAANPIMPSLDGLRADDIDPKELERALLHALFRPSPAVISAVAQRVFPPNESYVSVHARTGADVDEVVRDRFEEITQDLTMTAHRMLNCTSSLDPIASNRIFLASDSHVFKDEFIKIATLKGVQVRTNDGLVLHIDRFQSGTNFGSRRELCAAFLDVFADAYALGLADSIIFLHSGFAFSAIDIGTVQRWHEYDLTIPSQIDQCRKRNKYYWGS